MRIERATTPVSSHVWAHVKLGGTNCSVRGCSSVALHSFLRHSAHVYGIRNRSHLPSLRGAIVLKLCLCGGPGAQSLSWIFCGHCLRSKNGPEGEQHNFHRLMAKYAPTIVFFLIIILFFFFVAGPATGHPAAGHPVTGQRPPGL